MPMSSFRRALLPLVFLLIGASTLFPIAPAAAAASCSAFSSPIRDQTSPTTKAQLLTRSSSESASYAGYGFTHNRGLSFMVAPSAGSSLGAVHRLYKPSNRDLFYSLNTEEIARAVRSYGYQDQGVAFYASTSRPSCLMPVTDYYKGGIHRFITRSAEAVALEANGWSRSRVRFYVGAPPSDPAFSVGVIPDTQQEVLSATDTRYANRTQWLASSRSALDLRYVVHVGDSVNWDTTDHVQYRRAQSAMRVLNSARVPYTSSIGNHDTAAVCAGGSACDPARTRTLLRDTRSFNTYLNQGTDNLEGRYEAGKVDNTYATFTAGGLQWLVLNLEFWPRAGAVDWARTVVARHPRHNVIVSTHSYLSSGGGISSYAAYGDSSPRDLYDRLIKVYPNIRIVVSGHVGTSAYRVDRGLRGNTIYSMLLCMHDNRTNPTRLISINTSARTMSTRVYSPYTRQSYSSYNKSYTGVSWVR